MSNPPPLLILFFIVAFWAIVFFVALFMTRRSLRGVGELPAEETSGQEQLSVEGHPADDLTKASSNGAGARAADVTH
jgi:hypothetical protein